MPSVNATARRIGRFCLLFPVLGLSSRALAQSRVDCGNLNSRVLHHSVRYCVMLPPSYATSPTKKFPVLYFLHGLGEDEQALLRSGSWELIEDLWQQRKIGEFVIAAPEGGDAFFINSADGRVRYSDFLIFEFLPYIETHFHTVRGRQARGVSGFSMGGYGALRLAFAHPELFGSVSVQSPALITESPTQLDADLRNAGPLAHLLVRVFGDPINAPHWNENSPFILARQNQAQIKAEAIYLNCGQQDEYGFAKGATQLHQQLRAEGIRHEFHLYPGGHSASYFFSHIDETMEFHSRAFAHAPATVR
jgi:enterochelin esterase-like enzyme